MRLTGEDVTIALSAAADRARGNVVDPEHIADVLNERLADLVTGRASVRGGVPGRCRECGCTNANACVDVVDAGDGTKRNCAWADAARTLCDNPSCLASVNLEAALHQGVPA